MKYEPVNLTISSSPHAHSKNSTAVIMRDVCIALLPALIAAIYFFGWRALTLTLVSVLGCVFFEWGYRRVMKKDNTVSDWSAVVTGMILSLNLPPVVPFYVPIVGGFFAIVIVKMLFGGIGKNFANPAITARIFLLLCWTGVMTSFVSPITLDNGANLFFLSKCNFRSHYI